MKTFQETAIKYIASSLVQISLTALLFIFKYFQFWFFADWSYWWVFAPLWVPVLFIIGLYGLLLVGKFMSSVYKDVNRS